MLACGMGIVALVAATLARVGVTGRELYASVALAALAPLALGTVVLTRFDLWPALLIAAALAALVSGRDRLGFGLLGLATAAKLFPAVLLPVALVYAARRGRQNAWQLSSLRGRRPVLLPFLTCSRGVWASIERQTGRPLQIESLGRRLLLAASSSVLYEPTVVSTFGSQNLSGSLPDRARFASDASSGRRRRRGLARSRASPRPDRRAPRRLGCGGRRLRRVRKGPLAAVPDLARSARAARGRRLGSRSRRCCS